MKATTEVSSGVTNPAVGLVINPPISDGRSQ